MLTRRHFLRNSSTVAVGCLVASAALTRAADASAPAPSVIKVGLIGCGGRGTGAALQALKADPGVRLTALADVFADRLDSSLATLKKMTAVANRIDVTPATSFVGLDAYQKVIDSGVDVVLLASTPAFRPEHFRAAVAAGKHVFCEKPVAVDGPGIRSVLASAAEAQRKNLSVMSGFCWRYDPRMRATVAQIHAGAIGDLRAIIATYHTGTLTTKFPGTRTPGQTDLEWQLRNWYNFTWLSGDHLVEQAIHNVDKIAWLMKQEMPTQAIAVGGRTVPAYGNTYDNFSVAYEYASGVRATLSCRQHDGVYNEVTDYVMGTEGIFSNGRLATQGITGKTTGNTPVPPATCIRSSTMNSSPPSAPANPSTTASAWPTARSWPSWAAWPLTPAKSSLGIARSTPKRCSCPPPSTGTPRAPWPPAPSPAKPSSPDFHHEPPRLPSLFRRARRARSFRPRPARRR